MTSLSVLPADVEGYEIEYQCHQRHNGSQQTARLPGTWVHSPRVGDRKCFAFEHLLFLYETPPTSAEVKKTWIYTSTPP
jgi:hypothetical protein